MNYWCVLRMAGCRTLPVVRSLVDVGLNVWTPTAKRRRTLPRSTKYRDEDAAVLPTFAFAGYEDLERLCAILIAPVSRHPAFRLLRYRGNVALVRDEALQPLREYEAWRAENWDAFVKEDRLARKRKKGRANPRRAYVLGQRVRIPDTPFEGLNGKVEECRRNGDLVIVFDLGGQITVNSCLVEPIQLESNLPEQGTAARAA